MIRETIVMGQDRKKKPKRCPWMPRGTGRQKQAPHRRRVVCYMDEALYARLQTAAWVRATKRGRPGSLNKIMVEVLDLALPAALPIPQPVREDTATS